MDDADGENNHVDTAAQHRGGKSSEDEVLADMHTALRIDASDEEIDKDALKKDMVQSRPVGHEDTEFLQDTSTTFQDHGDNNSSEGPLDNTNEIPRQVSVDSSTHNSNSDKTKKDPNTVNVADGDIHSATASRDISSEQSASKVTRVDYEDGRGRSRKSSFSSDRGSSGHLAKDWGWFEDVHFGELDGKEDEIQKKIASDGVVKSIHNVKEGDGKKKKLTFFFDSMVVNDSDEVVPAKVEQEGTLMAVTAPTYVLEESRSSQKLWKVTAGTRPPQPVEERAFFEKMWVQNFQKSQVDYQIPADVLTATSPVALSPFADGNFEASSFVGSDANSEGDNRSTATSKTDKNTFYGNSSRRSLDTIGPYDHHHTFVNKTVKDDNTDDELNVVVRGDNVFGTTVSKSFIKKETLKVVTVSISIASYRVVESKKHGKYAQFLVIFCEGTFRNTVGVWKRYSAFDKLSNWVTRGHESCTSALAGMNPLAITDDPHDHEMLPNAVTSWKLMKKRKRWFRCLDAGYLSLKAFLLERFLHDILFESTTPDILREFVGLDGIQKKENED